MRAYVAQAPFGFSGFVSYPRLAFTPLELLLNWLPSPCAQSYCLRGGALLPRLLWSLCPAVPVHLKRGQPPLCGGEARSQQFPRSRDESRADRGRLTSSPLDAAAPSDSVGVPDVVGIAHSRFPSVHWATSTQLLNPDGVISRFRHLRGIEATSSAWLPNRVCPQSGTLSGVCDYSGRALVSPPACPGLSVAPLTG